MLTSMALQVEVLIGEELPLAGKVSMVIGVSILILLVVVADLILHTVTTVLKLRPLISEPDRLLLPFEVGCLLRFKNTNLLLQPFERFFTLLTNIRRG